MKRYILIALKSLMIHIDVVKDGKTVTKKIEFSGGSRSGGKITPGQVKTDDPDVIKFLETNQGFNTKWKLVEEKGAKTVDTTDDTTDESAAKEGKKGGKKTAKTPANDEVNKVSGTITDEEVDTMAKARVFILEKRPELNPADLNLNKAELIAKSIELGFDFPNFK